MLLSSKHLTPVIGLDIHIVILLGFPVPLPHPYIGLVIDPMDYIPFIGSTINVNNVPRGKSDTSGLIIILFHIPMGGPFLLAPMIGHDSVNFFGSQTTKAEGTLMSPSGHFLMTCNDIGIPLSLQPGKKFKPIPSLYLPTSFSIPLPLGKPVMLGGPYVPDWAGALLNLVMSFGFGALLKVGKKVGRKALTKFNHVLKGTVGTNKLSNKLCKMGFEPVDLVQGIVAYEGNDFELPGPLPLRWDRAWYSDSHFEGLLGHGTHSSYDMRLQEFPAEDSIVVLLPDGRDAVFESLSNVGDSDYHRHEKLTLTRTGWEEYTLFAHDTRRSYFFRKEQSSWQQYRLYEVQNEAGFNIRLRYSSQGRLEQIADSAGRRIVPTLDNKGRITSLTAHHRGQQRLLVRYAYNEDGDLAEITDALGQVTGMRYEQHLMRSKTDRNGQTFYWEYDGDTTGARCVFTTGEGGILQGRLEYFPEKGFNRITNSLGHTTTYHYTPEFVVTQVTDPLGYSTFTEYTDFFEVYRQTDEAGNTTGYTYDGRGELATVVKPDGAQERYLYNESGKLMLVADPQQRTRVFTYNEQGLLATITEADSSVTAFRYNAVNQIASYRKDSEQPVELAYDEDHNLVNMTRPGSGESTWVYDEWGQCLVHRTPLREEEAYLYDVLGRVTWVRQPDNNIITIGYDAYDQVTELKDRHHHVRMDYNAAGSLQMRETAGEKTFFRYDTENRLVSVINERGEQYAFTRNACGDTIQEKGFDDIVRQFIRDETGKVVRINRPGARYTDYEYDSLGNITRIAHNDGSWELFSYDRSGLLTEATNEYGRVRLIRDSKGLITEEWQNGHLVRSKYNKKGLRTGISSSLGADIRLDYNQRDRLTGIQALCGSDAWETHIGRNAAGQEEERLLPGNISSAWSYDSFGRPLLHTVRREQKLHERKYQWDARQLKHLSDWPSGRQTTFAYDAAGHLSEARHQNGQHEYRVADAAGNYYKTRERIDRNYGQGGRLLRAPKTDYRYDEEGNLVEKAGRDGALWRYEWYGSGMLRRVLRPDGREVLFEYDALGRRTLKQFDGQITRWVWNGDVPLHEWTYKAGDRPVATVNEMGLLELPAEPVPDGTLITWIFDERTQRPAARLEAGKQYSIICDHLGTPREAYDTEGQKVWGCALDIYGARQHSEGNPGFVPFRFQGQYEDAETGLYYNRFRYYDPESGTYISQDPIGLQGGLALYAYVHDTNTWLDLLGLLELVYQLLNDKGEVIYYGITDRSALTRGNEHIAKGKVFSKMEVLAENLNHDQARTMEAQLIRERLEDRIGDYKATDSIEDKLRKSGLLNKNRGRDIDVPGRKYTGDIPKLDAPRNVDGLKLKCN